MHDKDIKSRLATLEPIAHVRKKGDGSWDEAHPLETHALGVARLAESFASAFGNADWARLAGLWHDLGKYKPAFQDYIRLSSGYEADEAEEGGPGRVDHSIVGALWAKERYEAISPAFGKVFGYLIAGHHAGLPDWRHEMGTGGALETRLADGDHLGEAMKGDPPQSILAAELATSFPGGEEPSAEGDALMKEQLHLWIRMLFSCLVDADFLDTEAYMNPGVSKRRAESSMGMREAKGLLDASLRKLEASSPDTLVNRTRRAILAECRERARLKPGLFSLTVPTGGGKTLAGMAFALEHAILHGKRRVIVAIPYTSIIEQTAATYRAVFGHDAVLEHHSNLDPERESSQSKLATENWDAPIVVTTNVQLFESLFSARGSVCRKLHNLAESVIILDEAQMLPVGYLQPVVSVIKGLVELFKVSVVLSTATQPALAGRLESGMARLDGFREGAVRELMSDPAGLARTLRRVELRLHPKGEERVTWEEIASELVAHKQVLCVVNTRKDCRELHGLLPKGAIHLSALMCPEHRSEVVEGIKKTLRAGMPIRVVSTQLVEAGVDLDFPVVYRALAGLDSIAQAAGRCNREGRLGGGDRLGSVVVFLPLKDAPPGTLRKGQDTGLELLRLFPDEVGRLEPEVFRYYFELFYSKANGFDDRGMTGLLCGPDLHDLSIQFRTASSRFSLIDDGGRKAIIVWYASARDQGRESYSSEALVNRIEAFGPDRDTLRRLQRFAVNVPFRVFELLARLGAVRGVKGMDGLHVQALPGLYDQELGLRLEGPELSAEDFIA